MNSEIWESHAEVVCNQLNKKHRHQLVQQDHPLNYKNSWILCHHYMKLHLLIVLHQLQRFSHWQNQNLLNKEGIDFSLVQARPCLQQLLVPPDQHLIELWFTDVIAAKFMEIYAQCGATPAV